MTKKTTEAASAGAVELSETDLTDAQGAQVKLKPVQVTSYQLGASSGDRLPIEQVNFNFTKILSGREQDQLGFTEGHPLFRYGNRSLRLLYWRILARSHTLRHDTGEVFGNRQILLGQAAPFLGR